MNSYDTDADRTVTLGRARAQTVSNTVRRHAPADSVSSTNSSASYSSSSSSGQSRLDGRSSGASSERNSAASDAFVYTDRMSSGRMPIPSAFKAHDKVPPTIHETTYNVA